jgi:hypothetical protein
MSRILVHVFRKGLSMAYSETREEPSSWSYSRTIPCDESPYGSGAKSLIAGLRRDGFYIPSAAA